MVMHSRFLARPERLLRRLDDARIKTVMDQAMSGDYDNLLATVCEHFDVS